MYELKNFKVPKKFRGKNVIYTQLWWFVQATLFAWSPQIYIQMESVFITFYLVRRLGKMLLLVPTAKNYLSLESEYWGL
ncbi:putative acyl transferase [Klebsiella quasipneumoniae]|nr:putative acyl transferase [Klebsiella quasipneumoniae]